MNRLQCGSCGTVAGAFDARCPGCGALLPLASTAGATAIATATGPALLLPAGTLVGRYRIEGTLGAAAWVPSTARATRCSDVRPRSSSSRSR